MNRIFYDDLNSRQKENYNYAKLASILADYGFVCHRLTDDWQGADLIAQHIDGGTFLKVQLKGRLTVARKYLEKGIHIAFWDKASDFWYLMPHDEVVPLLMKKGAAGDSRSWCDKGSYSFPGLSRWVKRVLEPYRLNG